MFFGILFFVYLIEVKKLLHTISLVLFISAQLIFLLAILLENEVGEFKWWIFVAFTFLALLSYRKKQYLHHYKEHLIDYSVFLFVALGSFLTYFLQKYLELNTVFSAGLVGFLGSFLPNYCKNRNAKSWSIALYSGAFVGMTTLNLGFLNLALATFLTGVFFIFSQHHFFGIGGKLGTLAFMGVMYSYFILKWLH